MRTEQMLITSGYTCVEHVACEVLPVIKSVKQRVRDYETPFKRNNTEITFVRRGNGTLNLNGKKHRVSRGTLISVQSFDAWRIAPDHGETMILDTVKANEGAVVFFYSIFQKFNMNMNMLFCCREPIFLDEKTADRVEIIFDRMYKTIDSDCKENRDILTGAYIELIGWLLRYNLPEALQGIGRPEAALTARPSLDKPL